MPTLMDDLRNVVQVVGLQNAFQAALYPYRRGRVERRWPEAGRAKGNLEAGVTQWRSLAGRVLTSQVTRHGIVAETETGMVEVLVLAADLVRVRYLPAEGDAVPEPAPYALAKRLEEWAIPAFTTTRTEEHLELRTAALTVQISLATGLVTLRTAEGRVLRSDLDAARGAAGEVRHCVALAEGERLFGLGERATAANRRGRTHILWNTDPAGYADGDDPINLNIPVYVGQLEAVAGRSLTYLVFYENPYYAEFDLGESTPDIAAHRFAGGELRYYVAVGPAPRLLERYTELTGRHELPPLWMLGYHQCRWSYDSAERVRKLAQDFQEHAVPCDAIYLDIDYMDGFRCFTWDRERFPDLAGLTAELRAQGIKTVAIIDPGLKKDAQYASYREAKAAGHLCKLPDGSVFHAPVWPGLCGFPDFTAPSVREWWGEQYRPLLEAGVAGFWNDMNEPAVFTNGGDPTLPLPVQHQLEGRGGDHAEAHNLYGMQMVRASRDGLLRLRPAERPVVITRAGWAGVQRYSISWTADNESTWSALRLTVPLMLGLGLSGIGFSGPDIGGFVEAADGELFTRWLQLAAFMPLFRAHTAKGTPDQEPWSYGEPYLAINRRFIELRYELLLYLYTTVWQLAQRGWPVVRPLGWLDESLWGVEDAFLCGDALLVAPVGEAGATAREVTLPAGSWYDFWTNRRRAGGAAFEQFASLETLPLFVRAGTVLLLGEVGSSVEHRLQKFLRLHIYPLTEDGEAVSVLYEDAGEGFGYQHGEQQVSHFVMRRAADRLTIIWEKTGEYAPPYEHIALTLQGLRRAPQKVLVDGEPFAPVQNDQLRHSSLLGVPLFERLEIEL
ncbi:MAG: DUF4968 domain-containing protein [Anaerolineae bacterium]|nr:DUF4968 domain-containing protein [Anaerolineae bacterium]